MFVCFLVAKTLFSVFFILHSSFIIFLSFSYRGKFATLLYGKLTVFCVEDCVLDVDKLEMVQLLKGAQSNLFNFFQTFGDFVIAG